MVSKIPVVLLVPFLKQYISDEHCCCAVAAHQIKIPLGTASREFANIRSFNFTRMKYLHWGQCTRYDPFTSWMCFINC